MRKWLLLLGLACAWMLPVAAQAQQFSMQVYGRKSGLESQVVNALFQDSHGFIWAGTEMGLYRFNGASFVRMGRSAGFATGEFVSAITEDREGRLWIATQSGLRVGDGEHFQAVPWKGRELVPDAGRRIEALADGRLLLVLGGRVQALSAEGDGQWSLRPLFDAAQLQAHPDLGEITALQLVDGNLWMGCARRVCELADGTLRVFGPDDGVPEDVWSGFYRDRGGALWLRGTHVIRARPAGAVQFERRDIPGQAMDILTDDMAVVEDAAGRILTRTNKGLARWEQGRWTVFGPGNGLPDVGVTALLFDRDGDLWIGTYGRGLYLWSGYGVIEGWARGQGMDTVPNWSILRDDRGRMWFGNELGGNLLDPAATVLEPWPAAGVQPPPRQALSMQKAPDGAIWMALYDGRLLRSDPLTGETAEAARLPVFVKAIRFDRRGRLWIASMRGVFVIEHAGEKPRAIPAAQIPATQCSDIAEAADGTLWFACNSGLLRLQGERWTAMHSRGTVVPGGYIAVAADTAGDLWLGANEPGLFRGRVQGDTLDVARIEDRWLDNTLAYFVRYDRRGWLWVGGDAGVDVNDGRRWVHVSQDSGLLWDETGQNAFFEDTDGSVWVGSAIGVSHVLHPEAIFRPRRHAVVITDVTHGQRRLDDGATVAMGAQQAPLTFRFARLGPASGSAPHYRYRLLGTEAGWVESATAEVNMAALPAGRYRFEVQAIDDDQRQLSPPAAFDFSVPPPWWWSWWALLGLMVAIAALLVLAWRWRVRALMAQNRRLDATVQQRTAELQLEKNQLERARAELYVQATFDELTGLLSRRAILEKLAGLLADRRRRSRGVALALMDLDHFKRVNDSHGHQAGDAVLRAMGLRLAGHVRGSDMLGRYGGEELLLVMEGVDADEALHRLEAIRRDVGEMVQVCEGVRFVVTLSAGMVWIGDEQTTMHALITRADRALYAAKQGGRNRVAMAGA